MRVLLTNTVTASMPLGAMFASRTSTGFKSAVPHRIAFVRSVLRDSTAMVFRRMHAVGPVQVVPLRGRRARSPPTESVALAQPIRIV